MNLIGATAATAAAAADAAATAVAGLRLPTTWRKSLIIDVSIPLRHFHYFPDPRLFGGMDAGRRFALPDK